MRKAFRRYPLELAACPELAEAERERDFFGQCRRHFDHIGHTVAETFCTPGYGLEADDAVLEPSYICEPLGLQGPTGLHAARRFGLHRDEVRQSPTNTACADAWSLARAIACRCCSTRPCWSTPWAWTTAACVPTCSTRATRYSTPPARHGPWCGEPSTCATAIVAAEYAVQRRNDPAYTARLLATIDSATLNERGLTGRLWHDYQGTSHRLPRRPPCKPTAAGEGLLLHALQLRGQGAVHSQVGRRGPRGGAQEPQPCGLPRWRRSERRARYSTACASPTTMPPTPNAPC